MPKWKKVKLLFVEANYDEHVHSQPLNLYAFQNFVCKVRNVQQDT